MSPRSFSSAEELGNALLELLPVQRASVIAIDGLDGSGKSTLAKGLVQCLDGSHLELDKYLHRNRGGYLDFLRYEELADDLLAAGEEPGAAIVEGVCVHAVLDRLGVRARWWIYVRRVIAGRHWSRGDFLEKYQTAEEAIAGETSAVQEFAQITGEPRPKNGQWLPGVTKELITYHYDYRPHERADFIFEREASSG